MSSSSFDLYQLFWSAFIATQGVLCLWIAIIVFRKRSIAAWITLVVAILSPLFAMAGHLWLYRASGSLTSGFDRDIEIYKALYLGHAVTLLIFLLGVLLHLQRRKLESDRIADLEAILHDLQQRPKDAPTQPPR